MPEDIEIRGWLSGPSGCYVPPPEERGREPATLAGDVIRQIDAAAGPVVLALDCLGGSIAGAFAVAAAVERCRGRGHQVIAHVSRAWSSAPVIFSACDLVLLEPGDYFHPATGTRPLPRILIHGPVGTVPAEERRRLHVGICRAIAARSRLPAEGLVEQTIGKDEAAPDREPGSHAVRFNADDALRYGLVHAVGTLADARALAARFAAPPPPEPGRLTEAAFAAIVADKLAARAVTAAKLDADAIATSDYAEDGSGNPTAGAKMIANTTYTAWASGTAYSVGDIRSNGGRSYRCATAGTSAGGAAAWASGTTYAAGALVSYAGRTYYSLQAGNTNHQPDTSPTWWEDRGANTGPSADGRVWDGTAKWDRHAQFRVGPAGVQIGAVPLNSVIQGGNQAVYGTATQVTVTLPRALPDTNYRVALTPTGSLGTVPAPDCFIVYNISKTTTSFTFYVLAAPGTGNYVYFDWVVLHDIP